MADARSTIRVDLIGDARGLTKTLDAAERSVGGFGANAGKLLAGGLAALGTKELFDFAQSALGEADRLGDAIQRLEGQIGTDLARAVDDVADDFTHLGQSRQDVLELAAAFADTATALGVGAPDIAAWADDAAAIAAALELQGVGDAAGNIDLIGKAAAGGERALRALGVNLTDAEVEARAMANTGKDTADALTEGELAAAGYELILEKLQGRLGDVSAANGDLEQSQAEVQAKLETLSGKIGDAVDGPLNDLLTWIISGIEGWELFAEKLPVVREELRKMLGPIYAVTDALAAAVGLIGDLLAADDELFPGGRPNPKFLPGGSANRAPSFGGSSPDERGSVVINVQGGDPAEVERSVRRAIAGYSSRNGTIFPE